MKAPSARRHHAGWSVVPGVLVATAVAVFSGGLPASAGAVRSAASRPQHSFPIRSWQPPATARSRAALAAASGPTIPMWSHSFTPGANSYAATMVGTDPFDPTAPRSSTIPTQVIPIAITFTGTGHVYDPTTGDAQCLNGASAVSRTRESPIFASRRYQEGGTALGRGQFADIFQRANFWSLTNPHGIARDYHVRLAYSRLPTLRLSVSGTEVDEPCGRLGMIDINTFNGILLQNLARFHEEGVSSTTFPIFLVYNVVFYDTVPSNCCTLGYHAAIPNPYDNGIQTFAIASFDSTGAFSGTGDVGVLAHEVGEWMDDPTVANSTPPWGHTGQVATCQSNLEVGDPLTGTAMSVPMPNGVVYHPQELAFASWFYSDTPSLGVNGWYSLAGTFRAPASLCSG